MRAPSNESPSCPASCTRKTRHCPHASWAAQPPISRIGLTRNNLLRLHIYGSDDTPHHELVAAKMMGRWRRGCLVDLSPDKDDPAIAADPNRRNNFTYAGDDKRRSLDTLLRSVALDVHIFSSTQEFMHAKRPEAPGCLVLDVRLPGMSGLTFQQELAKAGVALPIIFISGHGDVAMTVRAMKAGAAEFLTKPFEDQVLLDVVHAAIERDRARRRDAARPRRAEGTLS